MSGSYSGTFTASSLKFTGSLIEDSTTLTATHQSSKGYTRLPGGLIIQWGWYSGASGAQTITYPLTFPTEVVSITVTPTRTSNAGLGSMDAPYIASGGIGSGSRSSFVVYWSVEGNGMAWQAIGR